MRWEIDRLTLWAGVDNIMFRRETTDASGLAGNSRCFAPASADGQDCQYILTLLLQLSAKLIFRLTPTRLPLLLA